jgi:hypothetical protein
LLTEQHKDEKEHNWVAPHTASKQLAAMDSNIVKGGFRFSFLSSELQLMQQTLSDPTVAPDKPTTTSLYYATQHQPLPPIAEELDELYESYL